MRIGVISISDRSSRGLREDISGTLLSKLAEEFSQGPAAYQVVPDEKGKIQEAIIAFTDDLACRVVLTTGGTGVSPRDVTPEATLGVIERSIPGIGEILRLKGSGHTPFAVLSRNVAGIRGNSLIVNLPGSPEAVKEAFEILKPVLAHAVGLIQGDVTECKQVRMRGE